MKYNREVAKVEKAGGDIRTVEAPKALNDPTEQYVQCPHCERRFDPEVAARHVPRCKDIVNKPQPPPSARVTSKAEKTTLRTSANTKPTCPKCGQILSTINPEMHIKRCGKEDEKAQAPATPAPRVKQGIAGKKQTVSVSPQKVEERKKVNFAATVIGKVQSEPPSSTDTGSLSSRIQDEEDELFAETEASLSSSASVQALPVQFCHMCGKKYFDGAMFCAFCGTKKAAFK